MYYLDTSVAMHSVQPDGDPHTQAWIQAVVAGTRRVVSSRLLSVELARALRRDGLATSLSEPLLQRIFQIDIDREVLRTAAAIEPHVKSLDAIHLATCLRLGSPMLVTHDQGMLRAAEELGLTTYDPLAG